jgi:predicted Zn-ribbon and HTH transcriptional regulator
MSTTHAPKRNPRQTSRRDMIESCRLALRLIDLNAKTHIISHVTQLSPDQVRDLQKDVGMRSPPRGAVRSLARIGRTKERLIDMAVFIACYTSLAKTPYALQIDVEAWIASHALYQRLRGSNSNRAPELDINEAWQVVVGLRKGNSPRDDLKLCSCKTCGFTYPDVGVHYHTDCPLCHGRRPTEPALEADFSDIAQRRPLAAASMIPLGHLPLFENGEMDKAGLAG